MALTEEKLKDGIIETDNNNSDDRIRSKRSRRSKTSGRRRARAWELDALRGLAIIMVVWDHFMYTVGHIFYLNGWEYTDSAFLNKFGEFALDYWDSTLRLYGWPVFVFIFFFVSGICTAFSRNNFFRGLKLAIVALAVTGITYLLENVSGFFGVYIQFGVLHCLALCILIFAFISLFVNLLNKLKYGNFIKAAIYALIAIALYIINAKLNVSLIDMQLHGTTVPDTTPITGMFLYTNDWWTADYFPLLPFFAFFMTGAALAPVLYPHGKSLLPFLDGKWNKFLTVPGKYSLYIYLCIQVVSIALLWLLTLIVTGESYFI